MRLRPGDEYRLSDGDVLYLGEKVRLFETVPSFFALLPGVHGHDAR
jgi:hypothetical protein